MRTIARAADRMLSVFVPKITADAGCSPGTFTYFCYCKVVGNEFDDRFTQTCTRSPTCALYCQPCIATGVC